MSVNLKHVLYFYKLASIKNVYQWPQYISTQPRLIKLITTILLTKTFPCVMDLFKKKTQSWIAMAPCHVKPYPEFSWKSDRVIFSLLICNTNNIPREINDFDGKCCGTIPRIRRCFFFEIVVLDFCTICTIHVWRRQERTNTPLYRYHLQNG